MISDKELREAARKCEKALLDDMPEPEDCGAVFSSGFERKMKKLIFRVDHPVRFWLIRILPVLLAAGVIAAAVLLPGRAAEAEPPAPPEPDVSAAMEPEPKPEPAARSVIYRLTWLPEGCEWDREALYENEGLTVYRTPGGTEAVFLYAVGGDPAEAAATEAGREVLVGGSPALLYLGQNKEELNELFWSDGEAGVFFWLSAPFAEEDMIRAAESVEAEAAE